ncbi:hydrogenase subunit MbhD domain-containing protein, partial [Solemya elarraichensis gill symbiont]
MLLAFLVVIAFAVIHMRDLVAIIMLAGMYSLITAIIFVVMDAVDVAFTEAAVGAGISTVLMLATLSLTGKRRREPRRRRTLIPIIVVVLTGVT